MLRSEDISHLFDFKLNKLIDLKAYNVDLRENACGEPQAFCEAIMGRRMQKNKSRYL